MKCAMLALSAALASAATCDLTGCEDWPCQAASGQDSWCECFDIEKEAQNLYVDAKCAGDGEPCACEEDVCIDEPSTFANTHTGPGYYATCGDGHGKPTCPTATKSSQWCNNQNYPDRMSNSWCTAEFCEQCGEGFGEFYAGCTQGVQQVANTCRPCGVNLVGPCQAGVLSNDKKCHDVDPVSGVRLSLRSNSGCSANLCKPCGMSTAKPCNNGDGQPICDAGLSVYRHGNPSSTGTCVAEFATCGPGQNGDWTGACSTLPIVNGVTYNLLPIVNGIKEPDMNSPFVHGSHFIL